MNRPPRHGPGPRRPVGAPGPFRSVQRRTVALLGTCGDPHGLLRPRHSGRDGHPLPGETVEVSCTASAGGTVDVGCTGSAATVVDFGPASTTLPVTLGSHAVTADIPTSLLLPCAGTGAVVFTAEPGSPTVRPARLPVHYVGQP